MSRFWMVWNPAGYAPTFKHDTEESAVCEAERLARVQRGHSFFVLEATQMRLVDDMRRVDLRPAHLDPQEPPF